MIDFVGFGRGFQQRGDYNQGKRREMAEAFSKFKADNPYATQADFQSFIDQYSGGRNYIAGGAPSSEILASLAENNLRAKQLNEANQSLDMLAKQTKTKENLSNLIDNSLLALEPDQSGKVDFVGGFDKFRKQYGEVLGENDNPFLKGFNISDMYNEGRRNFLVSKRISEFLPQAYNLIERSNGQIKDSDLTMMGVPASMLTQVKQATQNKYEQDQRQKRFNNRRTLLAEASKLIADGSTNTVDSVGMLAQTLGISTTAPEAKKFLADIDAEAKRIRSIEDKDIANRLSDRRAQIKIDFRKSLQDDPLFVNAIRTGNQAEARRRIMYLTQDFQPETKSFLVGASEALIEDFETSLQLKQTDLLGEKRNKADATALTVMQAYPKNNMAKAEAHFGSVAKPNPNAGAQGGNAVLATQDLAKAFDLNTSTLVLLQEVYKNAPPGSDRAYLVTEGRNALVANGADTVTTAKQQLRSTTTLSQGGFGRPETFENWKNTTSDTIKTHFDTVDKKLDAIIALPATNAEEKELKIRRLNFLLSASMQGVNQISENIKFADKYSMGADTWITYGTPQWDNEAVDKDLTQVMKQRLLDAKKAIDDELKDVNALTFKTPTPSGNNQVQGTGASSFLRYFNSVSKKSDLRDQLFANLSSKNIEDTVGFNTGFDVYSPVTSLVAQTIPTLKSTFGSYSDQQLENNKLVYGYLATKGNLDAILKDGTKYAEFNADPVGYVKSKINMGN